MARLEGQVSGDDDWLSLALMRGLESVQLDIGRE